MRPTPPAPAPARIEVSLEALTDRQRQCLTLASQGLTSNGIAVILDLSPRTVDEHLAEACRLLGVRTRIQAVARWAARSPGPAIPPP